MEKRVTLPHCPSFGLEDLGGRVRIQGPFEVCGYGVDAIQVCIRPWIAGEERFYTETLIPNDPTSQGRANWNAAAKQLGLTP